MIVTGYGTPWTSARVRSRFPTTTHETMGSRYLSDFRGTKARVSIFLVPFIRCIALYVPRYPLLISHRARPFAPNAIFRNSLIIKRSSFGWLANGMSQIKIQKYTSTAQAGLPQEDPDLYEHVEHCLDSLLQDVYCHADDTPWYELPAEGYRDRYDKFQTRTCKSWDGLLEWADQYNACYKNDNVTDASGNELENVIEYYTYCPKNSPYKEAMIEHFREEGGPERKGFWEEYGGR